MITRKDVIIFLIWVEYLIFVLLFAWWFADNGLPTQITTLGQ